MNIKLLASASLCSFLCSAAMSQISWYNKTTLETWSEQPHFFSFVCDQNIPYPDTTFNDTNWVVYADFLQHSGITQVCFDAATDSITIDSLIQVAKNNSMFGYELPVITQDPSLGAEALRWVQMTDKVLIVFHEPVVSPAKVTQLADKYCLDVVHVPSSNLPKYSWSYVFKMQMGEKSRCQYSNAAEVARTIYEQEPLLVKYAAPDLIDVRPPKTQTTPFDIILDPDSIARDSTLGICGLWEMPAAQNESWYYHNDGTQVLTLQDADQDLCECMQQYPKAGLGARVAVMDFFGFGPHPEMDGSWGPGWDCINNVPIVNGDLVLDSFQVHGISTAGIIAAKRGNGLGIAGVAPNATVLPLLHGGLSSEFVVGVQKAIEFEADVINFSFASIVDNPMRHNEILGAYYHARPNPIVAGDTLGIIMVASAGNDNSNNPYYPGAYQETVGVYGHTANGNQWFESTILASNTGYYYDVAAASKNIFMLDYPGNAGLTPVPSVSPPSALFTCYGCDGVAIGSGTSYATAIVTGIASLMVAKNGEITAQEVKNRMRNGAKKIGPYAYGQNPQYPLQNNRFGFGLASCSNVLDSLPLMVATASLSNNEQFQAYYNGNHQIVITHPQELNTKVDASLYDTSGQLIQRIEIDANNGKTSVSSSRLAKGVYIISYRGSLETVYKSSKLLIY